MESEKPVLNRVGKQYLLIMSLATETTKPITLLSPLRWYTGYYSLEGTGSETLAQGAFIQIISKANQNSLFEISSIAISTDGVNVTTYTSGFTIDNIQHTITIPNVCNITLAKNKDVRAVASLVGTIDNKTVKGMNYLSPAPLEILAGSYKNVQGHEILSIAKSTNTDGPVFDISFNFADGHGATVITEYTYDPTMYLLRFNKTSTEPYTLMLGTGEGKGLACYVIGAGNPAVDTVLFTIPGGQ